MGFFKFFSGSVWFTSGSYYDNQYVTWDGDSQLDSTGLSFWADGKPPQMDISMKFNTIAYVRAGK
jgi:hypothetical protein